MFLHLPGLPTWHSYKLRTPPNRQANASMLNSIKAGIDATGSALKSTVPGMKSVADPHHLDLEIQRTRSRIPNARAIHKLVNHT